MSSVVWITFFVGPAKDLIWEGTELNHIKVPLGKITIFKSLKNTC